MDLDAKRKRVFLARDPRAYNGTTSNPDSVSGVYIVDARDPDDLELTTFHELPADHTSTCVNDCKYLWTGGPARRADMPADWGGRPVWVTDIRNPRRPTTFPDPVDTGRNDGRTDYSHDVQVDEKGIAVVSGPAASAATSRRAGAGIPWRTGAERPALGILFRTRAGASRSRMCRPVLCTTQSGR